MKHVHMKLSKLSPLALSHNCVLLFSLDITSLSSLLKRLVGHSGSQSRICISHLLKIRPTAQRVTTILNYRAVHYNYSALY